MNYFTILFGILAVAYAAYTFLLRNNGKDEKLEKLIIMKDKFGKNGSILHMAAYIVLPFIFGIIIIILGVKGVNFFE